MTCSVKIFGRPLSEFAKNDADYFRAIVVHDCWCVDCAAWRKKVAAHAIDVAQRIANDPHPEVW